jgi:hypothetical protein
MGRRPKSVLNLDMPFDEALERFIRVDSTEMSRGSPMQKTASTGTRTRALEGKKAVRSRKPKTATSSRARAKQRTAGRKKPGGAKT